MVDSFLRSEFKDPKLRVRGESCILGSLSGSAPFIFPNPPLSTPPLRIMRRDTPASCVPDFGPKSTFSKIRSRESFRYFISNFFLSFALLPFFLFFLELLIVYIRCSFDIGEIENRGKGISGGKKEKRNIEGSLTHHLYG